jgi:hypothetical protein
MIQKKIQQILETNLYPGSPDLIGGIGGALKGIKLSKAVLSSWKNVNFKSSYCCC